MRKAFLLFVFIVFTSLTGFSQLEVRPDSFKEVPGFININTEKMYDDNEKPYAVLKIKTENLSSKQRHELNFKGDAQTFFEVEYQDGEVWLYISYYATYIKISHEELSSTEFHFPFDMKPKCGYELTLVNKTANANTGVGSLTVNTQPENGANVFLNGIDLEAVTPYKNNAIPAGKHSLTVSKEGYKSVTEKVEINNGDVKILNILMPFEYGDIKINSEPQGAQVFIDNTYYGVTPLSLNGKITTGTHEIEFTKTNCMSVKRNFRLTEGNLLELQETLQTQKEVTITAGRAGNEIYIDNKLAGKSPLRTSLTFGNHIIKAIENGVSIEKDINVELNSEPQHIVLDFSNSISINSDVSGLVVYIDSQSVGITPYYGTVKCGAHKIKVSGKYGDKTRNIYVDTDGTYDLYFNYRSLVDKKNRNRAIGNTLYRGLSVGAFVGFNNIHYNGIFIKNIKDAVVNESASWGSPGWMKNIFKKVKNCNLSIRFVGGLTIDKRIFPHFFVEGDMLVYQERFKFTDLYIDNVHYDYYSENYSMVSIPVIAKIKFLEDRYEDFGFGVGYQWDKCFNATSKYKSDNEGENKITLTKDIDYLENGNSLVFTVFYENKDIISDNGQFYCELRVNYPLKQLTPQKDINFTTIMLTAGLRFKLFQWRSAKYTL